MGATVRHRRLTRFRPGRLQQASITRRAALVVILGLLGYLAAAGTPDVSVGSRAALEGAAWFSMRGNVTRVVDGDTLQVRIGKRSERVRLIGIDAPETGDCFAAKAANALRYLALNKIVRLSGDRTQTRRDSYKRLLAYVTVPNGVDAGRYLLAEGLALLYETRPPFARYRSYANVAAEASEAGAGLYPICIGGEEPQPTTPTRATVTTTTAPTVSVPTITTVPPPPPRGNCAGSYPDVCIPPPPPDIDCGQISFRNIRVVYNVASPDPHRFDGDRDGVGCES